MTGARVFALTCLALLAFAGNSLLARAALTETAIDAASFTTIRLVSGAIALWGILALRAGSRSGKTQGDWLSPLALFAYAACFSFAYLGLRAATGALLLFGAVQVTMIGWGLWTGERFSSRQWLGLLLAGAGLVGLLLPGLSAPPLLSACLMLAAGVAWGVYSIRGRGARDPLAVTAGNFMRAGLPALILSALLLPSSSVDAAGVAYAIASGALTSGVGYSIWYTALRGLTATVAATVQLSVPPVAAGLGALLLGEAITLRLAIAAVVILGGIALVIVYPPRAA
ncbi:MAG: DMT family transporter [Burkholderiales bacterium]